jgi:hypothetical protein
MRTLVPLLACLVVAAPSAHRLAAADSGATSLSPEEARDGWVLLWDGVTTRGWRGARGPDFPSGGWEIRDGVLSTLGGGKGGDIVTAGMYSDFELSVDFKVTPGANSGIKIFVDQEANKGPGGGSIGLEYQILDDALNPDARAGRGGNRTLGSLYDLYAPSPDKRPNPVGAWNTAVIVSKGAHVEHWLNGMRILEYTRFTPEFRRRVAQSKFTAWPGFGELTKGRILLQDHGDPVSFRNIKIRLLPGTAATGANP